VLTAVPLPDRPLSVLWQSTLVDLEPATRFGHRYDGAAVNTTLAVANDTGATLTFPLILATTDPEEHDPSRRAVRLADRALELHDADLEEEWETLAAAIRANGLAQGYSPDRLDTYLAALRRSVARASKSESVTLEPGEQRFIRTYQRKLLHSHDGAFDFRAIVPLPQFSLSAGGTIAVAVALPAATKAYAVELLDWTRSPSPQLFDGGSAAGLPLVCGRAIVAWSWGDDPELAVSYRYGA